MEEDLHGPGFDARGAAFPGVNLMVAARPRARLRLERHHRHLRQRRHLRRGALPGRRALPLQRPVPGDGQARAHELLDAERVDTTRRPAPRRSPPTAPCTASSTPAATVGGRKVAFTSARTHLLPRGRQRHRVLPHSTTRPSCTTRSPSARRSTASTSPSTGPTSTPTTSPTSSPARYPQRAPGHLARLPDPGHRRVRLAGLRPDLHTTEHRAAGSPPRTRSTRPTWSPGTTSRRRAGRPPTTSSPTARSSARR